MRGDAIKTNILSVRILPNADGALLEKLAAYAVDRQSSFISLYFGEDVS